MNSEDSASHRNPNPAGNWFSEHFLDAADQVIEFFSGDGIAIEGRRVADIGCGDGITDLGIALRAMPSNLTGYDIVPTDKLALLEEARNAGVADKLPDNLQFVTSEERLIPADDAEFDIAISWSAFEHVGEPISLLGEVRRILRPDGFFFLQLWPFYYSANGSHLWDWHEDFAPLLRPRADLLENISNKDPEGRPRGWTEGRINDHKTLNRLDLDELQRCMLAAGLSVRKFEVLSEVTRIPTELQRYPLSRLAISGVKLLATPTT